MLGSVLQSQPDSIFNKCEKCWHVTSEPMFSNFAFSKADSSSVIDNIKGCQNRKLWPYDALQPYCFSLCLPLFFSNYWQKLKSSYTLYWNNERRLFQAFFFSDQKFNSGHITTCQSLLYVSVPLYVDQVRFILQASLSHSRHGTWYSVINNTRIFSITLCQ
jgi:hypothetical protein